MQLFIKEEQAHDIDLCIDIDTQAHFLSDYGYDDSHQTHSSEHVMVIFILVIIFIMLTILPVANYLLLKMRKKAYFQFLTKYVHRKASSSW